MFLKEQHPKVKLRNDPHIVKSGMSKAVRMIGDAEESAEMMIQIGRKCYGSKSSPITKAFAKNATFSIEILRI